MLDRRLRELKRGDRVSQSEIEMMLGFRKTDDPDNYNLTLLGLKARIESWHENLGTPLFLKQDRGGLKAMEENEAAAYINRQAIGHLRGQQRCYKKLQKIDSSRLSLDEKRSHINNLAAQGYYAQVIRRVSLQLKKENPSSRDRIYPPQNRFC